MPYKSERQKRFFRGCKHNPSKMGKKCPSKKAIAKFEKHAKKSR